MSTEAAGAPGAPAARRLLRDRTGGNRVTNIELFFDLVYVFAVTQLSHNLVQHPTVRSALQSALLLAMVWLAWAYTTWVTNWMDPERLEVRLLLVVLALLSLAMSAALPRAFDDLGLGGAARPTPCSRWAAACSWWSRCAARCSGTSSGSSPGARSAARWPSPAAWSGGHARELLWLLAVCIDVAGGLTGFATPFLGRSRTADWTIEGGHFAERCQAFILIAIGESIVIIGATLSATRHITGATVAAFVVSFAGSVALWWLYFDRSAGASAEVIESSDDPGRIARSAYHLVHPLMVAGIIVTAAGDEKILTSPSSSAPASSAWMILGGPALFLAGHAAFKFVVWRTVPWTRLAGIAVLALLGLAVPVLPEIALAACAAAVVAVVAALDRVVTRPRQSP